MRRGQLGILSEVFLLILILSIFSLFWSYYTKNSFMLGLLKVRDTRADTTCSGILFPLVSHEYIKSIRGEEIKSITDFKEKFNISEIISYPTPDYLLRKVRDYYSGTGIRVNIKVYNGTEWLGIEEDESNKFIKLLLGNELQPSGTCSLPIYSLISDYYGLINMSVNI